MSWLVARLMGYAWPAVAGVVAGLLLSLGVQTYRLRLAKAEAAEVQNLRTLEKAQATQVSLAAQTEYRAKELQLQSKVEESQHAYSALQADHARALAAQRVVLADNGRLRADVAAYAAGSGSTAPDTVAAASERAARLGELLATALRLDAEHAEAAESSGDAVRALLAAWPK